MMNAKNELILVLGGARSGKSSWAQDHTEAHYASRLFLATARIIDEEIAEALKNRCRHVEAVLVDCLTVWLSNVLVEKGENEVPRYQEGLLEVLGARQGSVILVSNEVGMGIVPETPLGRGFRDMAGRLNQKIAAMADRVVFLVAGLPMILKGDAR